jgi:hypothetical protein
MSSREKRVYRHTIFRKDLDCSDVPENLLTYWEYIHVPETCFITGQETVLTRHEALQRGYVDYAHPEASLTGARTKKMACCDVRRKTLDVYTSEPWVARGCTRALSRVPATAPRAPPLVAVPRVLIENGKLRVHEELLANASLLIESAEEAAIVREYVFPHSGVSYAYTADAIMARDGIEAPAAPQIAIASTLSMWDFSMKMDAIRRGDGGGGGAGDDNDLIVRNRVIAPFEPVYLIDMYAAHYDRHRIALIRKSVLPRQMDL